MNTPTKAPAMYEPFAELDITQLTLMKNVRSSAPEIDRLAKTIKNVGLLEPLVVLPPAVDGGKFRVLFGSRRLAAAKKAKLAKIPCVIRADLVNVPEHILLGQQLVENEQRVDLTEAETATAYELLELSGMTAVQIADRLAKPTEHVAGRLAVAKLPEKTRAKFYAEPELDFESAAALADHIDDPEALDWITRQGQHAVKWRARQWPAEKKAREKKAAQKEKARQAKQKYKAAVAAAKKAGKPIPPDPTAKAKKDPAAPKKPSWQVEQERLKALVPAIEAAAEARITWLHELLTEQAKTTVALMPPKLRALLEYSLFEAVRALLEYSPFEAASTGAGSFDDLADVVADTLDDREHIAELTDTQLITLATITMTDLRLSSSWRWKDADDDGPQLTRWLIDKLDYPATASERALAYLPVTPEEQAELDAMNATDEADTDA